MGKITVDDFNIPNNDGAGVSLEEAEQQLMPGYDKETILELMKTSLTVFAKVIAPEEVTAEFADIHHNAWAILTESVMKEGNNAYDKYAIGIPRGHAKTFLLKLLCVFIILFTRRQFILITCATATLAENFLADVSMLMDNENVVRLFGNWRSDMINDKENLKKFYWGKRTINILPRGRGGAIRGASLAFKRPDVIICDDIQTRDEAMSEAQSLDVIQWFFGTLLKARSPANCTVVYLGNMYPDRPLGERKSNESEQLYCCLLRNLARNSEWLSVITGAILADRTALWEAVHPLESLLAELRQDTAMGQAEIFFAEIQNDPRAVNTRYFDPSKVERVLYTPYDYPVGKFIVIDPSLGKKKSDDQVVGLFYVYDAEGPVLQEIRIIQKSAPDLVEEVIVWALEEGVPLITAETVAYQATLLQWFAKYFEQLDLHQISLAGVSPRGMSKVVRILSYFKSLMAGRSKLSDMARPSVFAQAQLYDPINKDNLDDILDVGAYGEDVFVQNSSEYMLPLDMIGAPIPSVQTNAKQQSLLQELTSSRAGIH